MVQHSMSDKDCYDLWQGSPLVQFDLHAVVLQLQTEIKNDKAEVKAITHSWVSKTENPNKRLLLEPSYFASSAVCGHNCNIRIMVEGDWSRKNSKVRRSTFQPKIAPISLALRTVRVK